MDKYIPEYKRKNITPVDFFKEQNQSPAEQQSAGDLFSLKSGMYILFINKDFVGDFDKESLISYLNLNISDIHDKDIFILKKVEFSFSAFIEE
jgi:hypothetical protein